MVLTLDNDLIQINPYRVPHYGFANQSRQLLTKPLSIHVLEYFAFTEYF